MIVSGHASEEEEMRIGHGLRRYVELLAKLKILEVFGHRGSLLFVI
jgi:hypothetical protein